MAITKLLLLVVSLAAQQYGTTPPNVQPPAEQLREQHGSERIVPLFVSLTPVFLWAWALLEASVLVALSGFCPPVFARPLLQLLPTALTTDRATPLTSATPSYLAGTLLAVAGGALRAACYRTLGTRFTFELSIRPAHALVTDGVYGIVRHPSYTGLLGLAVGWLLCVLDPQGLFVSMLAASSLGTGDGRARVTAVLACVRATALGVLYVGISQRMDREDAMLEKHFGEAWRAWAKKVPYRLVPGVY